ncbi:tuberin-like [Elysia marginata]|uniref:Tuberin-like n=1 Tax=Elysia marginata TaxID=1093978 RepID=A0AAV4JT29_9GAST|nr:tuberin-like [Elysia marginata]
MSGSGKHPPLKEKVQRLFGFGRSPAPLTVPKTSTKEVIFTSEILKEIGPESPANNRIRTIRELCEVVRHRHLEEHAVEALWLQIADLVQVQVVQENRHLALHFLHCLLEGQLQFMTIMRGHFFRVIQSLTDPADIYYRLELFKTLSECGKNLLYFEDETGEFLLHWMPTVMEAGYIATLLPILLNVIKYNAAYLDEDVLSGLVQQTCLIPNSKLREDELNRCLEVMDAIICYSYLPSDSLYYFVAALCHTVDKGACSEHSWQLMKKLLGTYLGHSTVFTMLSMLQDKSEPVDVLLLRGAIFFTGMAIWGSRRVASIKYTYISVLPSFLQALSHENSIVAYEVVLNLQRLVSKFGKDLMYATWEIVLDILETLLNQTDKCNFDGRVATETHKVITVMENLHSTRQFFGPAARLFKIVEMCANKRSTSSVCALIDYHQQFIHPGKDNWIKALYDLMDKYLKGHTRTEVRKKALDVLNLTLSINTHVYEKELIEHVVIPLFVNFENDPDIEVRCKAVELLLGLCEDCHSNEFFELVHIVEKIIQKPLRGISTETEKREEPGVSSHGDDASLTDVYRAIMKGIDVFKIKLYTAPASHCQRLYELLTSHLELQYSHLYLANTACSLRKAVFHLLLSLRADCRSRVGLADRKPGDRHVYSPYCLCTHGGNIEAFALKSPTVAGLNPSQICAVLEYELTLKLILQCLDTEHDWTVLQTVLESLPRVLENKTLVLSANHEHIHNLCGKLCSMVTDRTADRSQKFINRPTNFTRSDFHTYVFPVLASMVTYHTFLDRTSMRDLVKCLEFGLVSKCAKICVTTLRICSLEMKELMMRMLPSVLLSLTKISATISMAIPVLAFLSSIVRVPKLYANFVEDQYMSVFAIALPYTNPFKFSHYTVSLAHHVIGVWFIRCRLPFRKGFVKYIQRGLKSNVLQLFEENSQRNLSFHNQDSSDRGRTGSLNEGRRRRRYVSGKEGTRNDGQIPMDEKMSQFHKELTETCLDMMARYSFGNFNALPKRSPVAQFLLKDGQQGKWVVGNKVVTVTTSGGGTKSGSSGLCDNCLTGLQGRSGSQAQESLAVTGASFGTSMCSSSPGTRQGERRRHRSMATLGSRSQSQAMKIESNEGLPIRRSQDDMTLPSERSADIFGQDDVAVQTGSSLSKEGMDPLLIESSQRHADKTHRAFSADQCSCWCTSWAEVNIRGASGVVSWMMRIENEASGYVFDMDPSLPDITQLLAPFRCKTPDSDSIGKIDSGSLCEEEYETLHSQHFSPSEKENCEKQERKAGSSPTNLRRISSSPSALSSSQERDVLVAASLERRLSHEKEPCKTVLYEESGLNKKAEDFSQAEPAQFEFDEESEQATSGFGFREAAQKSELSKKLSQDDSKAASGGGGSHVPPALHTTLQDVQHLSSSTEMKKPALQRRMSADQPGTKRRPEGLPLPSSHARPVKHHPVVNEEESCSSSSYQDEVPELITVKRRGHTISVMTAPSEAGQSDDLDSRFKASTGNKDSKGGLNPSFVFLQLYHCHPLLQSHECPLKVPDTQKFKRSVDMLDHIYPYETHKIGVLYMGKGQASEERVLLSNEFGSPRYTQFIHGLGQMISLEEAERDKLYLGGLNHPDDGKFAVAWQDESLRVIFHIATLMPTRQGDTRFNNKKSHIGNDFVTIVYNDSCEDYKSGTISGQFNFVSIVIRPLDYESNAVTLITKEAEIKAQISADIADILGHTHTKIISDANLPLLVRQIAVHCNLASMVLQRQNFTSGAGSPEVFASNWLERLRQIKLLRRRILEHQPEDVPPGSSASGHSSHGPSSSGHEPMTSPVHMWPPTGASGDGNTVGGYEDFTDFL